VALEELTMVEEMDSLAQEVVHAYS
jgi:hypothetical protein